MLNIESDFFYKTWFRDEVHKDKVKYSRQEPVRRLQFYFFPEILLLNPFLMRRNDLPPFHEATSEHLGDHWGHGQQTKWPIVSRNI